jgi:transposase
MTPKIDLEPYKDEILSWVSEKHTIPEILSKIRGILEVKYSLKTLKQALSDWGISRNKKNRSPEVKRIKLHISELFAGNYNNNIIL